MLKTDLLLDWVDLGKELLEALKLWMVVQVRITAYHWTAVAGVYSQTGFFLLFQPDWKALASQLIGTFLTVIKIFSLDIDAMQSFLFLVIFASSFNVLSQYFLAFGSLTGQLKRVLRVVMGGEGVSGWVPGGRAGAVIDERKVLFLWFEVWR